MWNLLVEVKDNFNLYFGFGWYLLLFLSGLLYLLLNKKRTNMAWNLAAGCTLVLFASFFPPCFYIVQKCIGMDVYWRYYWLLPVNALLAYVFVEGFPKKEDSRMIKAISIGVLLVFFFFGGACVLSDEAFTKSENAYELHDEAVELCDIILQQAKEDDTIKAIFPPQYVVWVRQYSAKVHMMYGRKQISKAGKKAISYYQYGVSKEAYEGIWELAAKYDYNYIIFLRDQNPDQFFLEKGYICIGVAGDYGVYKKE